MGRRRIVSRDRLEAPPPEPAPRKPSGFRARRLERRRCPGCGRGFTPVGDEKHCAPSHRKRAFWRRHHRDHHPKGKAHSPAPKYKPVVHAPMLCTTCAESGRETIFVPRFKGDDRCATCWEVPRWKRRSRRRLRR